jgi:hypothetical protein
MKLIYRGVSYEYAPNTIRAGNTGYPTRPAQTVKTPYTLIYRGVKTHVDPNQPAIAPLTLPASYDLIYRGVKYHVHRDEVGATTVTNPSSVTQRPRATASAKPVTVPSSMSPMRYLGRVHQANLMENLQRRLKVAQEKGDQRLIEMLEAERRQITAGS